MKESLLRVISAVSASEGDYGSVNQNTDGAGVSVGIWQWPQSTGGLGLLLAKYHQKNPGQFKAIFGKHSQALLDATARRSMAPVAGYNLWDDEWAILFRRAGKEVDFMNVQDELAMQSEHLRYAVQAARTIGVVSERALACILDVAVTSGPQFALRIAQQLNRQYAGQEMRSGTLLQEYISLSTRHFRRTTPPTKATSKPRLRWVQIKNKEWHLYSGGVNLYRAMNHRRQKILRLSLSDEAIAWVA